MVYLPKSVQVFSSEARGLWTREGNTWYTEEPQTQSFSIENGIQTLDSLFTHLEAVRREYGENYHVYINSDVSCDSDDYLGYDDHTVTVSIDITTYSKREATEEDLKQILAQIERDREQRRKDKERKKKLKEKQAKEIEKLRQHEIEWFIKNHPELEVIPRETENK